MKVKPSVKKYVKNAKSSKEKVKLWWFAKILDINKDKVNRR